MIIVTGIVPVRKGINPEKLSSLHSNLLAELPAAKLLGVAP